MRVRFKVPKQEKLPVRKAPGRTGRWRWSWRSGWTGTWRPWSRRTELCRKKFKDRFFKLKVLDVSFESSFQLSPARSNILCFFLAVMTLMHSNPTSYTFLAKLIKSFLPQNSELGFSSQHSPSFLFQLQCRKDELVDRTSGIVDQVHQLAVVGSGFQLPGKETERRILGSTENKLGHVFRGYRGYRGYARALHPAVPGSNLTAGQKSNPNIFLF